MKGIQINRSKAKTWRVSTTATTRRGKKIKPHKLRQLKVHGTPEQRRRAEFVLDAMALSKKR